MEFRMNRCYRDSFLSNQDVWNELAAETERQHMRLFVLF